MCRLLPHACGISLAYQKPESTARAVYRNMEVASPGALPYRASIQSAFRDRPIRT